MRRHVIVRAPVRISFGGGGTDLPAYYRRYGGFVVSAAIDRYCYVVASDSLDGGISINSADYGISQDALPGQRISVREPLRLAKAAIEWFQNQDFLQSGVDLFLSSEVRPGTGLGSSSAMTVSLFTALASYSQQRLGPEELAEIASHLEIERLGMPIGKQDQYASALGGLNAINFCSDSVSVRPLGLSEDVVRALSSRLLLFSTGQSRHSAQILEKQSKSTGEDGDVTQALHALKALAHDMEALLNAGRLDDFGRLLDTGWRLKKNLSQQISTSHIDRWYASALEVGCLGGKITGAGGGGFLLLYCPLDRQSSLRLIMANAGLAELPFDFDFHGAHLLSVTGTESDWECEISNVVSEHVLLQKRSDRARSMIESDASHREEATNAR